MRSIIIGIALVGSFAGALAGAASNPIINAGTPDAAMYVYDPALGRAHVVQLEYIDCLGKATHWYEDGSPVDCPRVQAQLGRAMPITMPDGSMLIPDASGRYTFHKSES